MWGAVRLFQEYAALNKIGASLPSPVLSFTSWTTPVTADPADTPDAFQVVDPAVTPVKPKLQLSKTFPDLTKSKGSDWKGYSLSRNYSVIQRKHPELVPVIAPLSKNPQIRFKVTKVQLAGATPGSVTTVDQIVFYGAPEATSAGTVGKGGKGTPSGQPSPKGQTTAGGTFINMVGTVGFIVGFDKVLTEADVPAPYHTPAIVGGYVVSDLLVNSYTGWRKTGKWTWGLSTGTKGIFKGAGAFRATYGFNSFLLYHAGVKDPEANMVMSTILTASPTLAKYIPEGVLGARAARFLGRMPVISESRLGAKALGFAGKAWSVVGWVLLVDDLLGIVGAIMDGGEFKKPGYRIKQAALDEAYSDKMGSFFGGSNIMRGLYRACPDFLCEDIDDAADEKLKEWTVEEFVPFVNWTADRVEEHLLDEAAGYAELVAGAMERNGGFSREELGRAGILPRENKYSLGGFPSDAELAAAVYGDDLDYGKKEASLHFKMMLQYFVETTVPKLYGNRFGGMGGSLEDQEQFAAAYELEPFTYGRPDTTKWSQVARMYNRHGMPREAERMQKEWGMTDLGDDYLVGMNGAVQADIVKLHHYAGVPVGDYDKLMGLLKEPVRIHSDGFGDFMEKQLLSLATETLIEGNGGFDLDRLEKKIAAYYQDENAKVKKMRVGDSGQEEVVETSRREYVKNSYNLLILDGVNGSLSPKGQKIREMVDKNGNVINREALIIFVMKHVKQDFNRENAALDQAEEDYRREFVALAETYHIVKEGPDGSTILSFDHLKPEEKEAFGEKADALKRGYEEKKDRAIMATEFLTPYYDSLLWSYGAYIAPVTPESVNAEVEAAIMEDEPKTPAMVATASL
jgi:hypothetical protein